MKVSEITNRLEEWAPKSLQEAYDNSGFICGDPNQELTACLLSLDCTEAVVEEAIARGCNLIISHHPILFKGLKSLTGKSYVERTIIKAIENRIALYAIHTNLDNVSTGVNSIIGKKMGLTQLKTLSPKAGNLKKLHTYVPRKHASSVRDALFGAGAGKISDYDRCSFNVEGIGTFRGGAGTNPFAGSPEKDHAEEEVKIEVIFESYLQPRLLSALTEAHPYEEVAFDIVSLDNRHPHIGSGMVGELSEPMREQDFLKMVSDRFECKVIRHTELLNKPVSRVAFCGGSGQFLLKQAIASGADVFVTGDFKYHEFFDHEKKIVILDIGHFESEQFTPELIQQFLLEKFPTFAVLLSEVNTNPVQYFISN